MMLQEKKMNGRVKQQKMDSKTQLQNCYQQMVMTRIVGTEYCMASMERWDVLLELSIFISIILLLCLTFDLKM